jgi:tripartite-type tricarboxylate transporter receptor subunit TctC
MKFPRRRFLYLTAGAAALPVMSRAASAQDYPTRPVRIIVGYPAATATDIVARLMGQWLSVQLGQQFFIDDRPGAGSNIATEIVVKAPPDGYTLLMPVATNAINATLYTNLNFNFIRDIAPVASVGATPFVMLVTPSFPAKTLAEFIAYAKANPRTINMASGGIGGAGHVFGELFAMMAGVDFVHVPYRSGYLPDLVAGQVQMAFSPVVDSIANIRSGKLRALAVTTKTRLEVLPDTPTVAEFVPGYEASAWQGLGAPKNTPAEIIARLNKAVNAGLADSTLKARLADLGEVAVPMTPADFAKFIAEETAKWAKVIKFAGIKAE